MDNEVHIVEQDPSSLPASLHRVRVGPELLLQAVLNLIGNGDDLTIVGGRGDEEEVGQTRVNGVKLEDAGVFALLVFTGCGCGLNEDAGLLVGLACRHSVG